MNAIRRILSFTCWISIAGSVGSSLPACTTESSTISATGDGGTTGLGGEASVRHPRGGSSTESNEGGGTGGAAGEVNEGGGTGGAAGDVDECDAYIKCALEVEPETVGSIMAMYGSEGSCFEQSASARSICEEACTNARAQLRDTYFTRGGSACGEKDCGEGWSVSPWKDRNNSAFVRCIPTCVAEQTGWALTDWWDLPEGKHPQCMAWQDIFLDCTPAEQALEVLGVICSEEDWYYACRDGVFWGCFATDAADPCPHITCSN